jgi:Zn-dependent protease
MQVTDAIFYVVILIMSVVIHEVAHGYTAYLCGDNTAYAQGRLTLNPLKHLDPFGSVILPLLLVILNAGFVVGWARPVPYNPDNLRNRRTGTMLVAAAGIVANLVLAVFFGILIRYEFVFGIAPLGLNPSVIPPFYKIAAIIVMVNLVLALFNLVPIPPLDGSKILFELLPVQWRPVLNFLERWGMLILLFFIIFLWTMVFPVIADMFFFLTGYPLQVLAASF